MEGKESGEGGVVDGEAASNSLYEGVPYVGNSGEKIGDDCGTPK